MRSRWIDPSLLNIKGDRATVRSSVVGGQRNGREEISPGRTTSSKQTAGSEKQNRLDQVGSNPTFAPKFDSKTERAYFSYLSALKFGGEIVDFWFHPMTLALPGDVSHKPDFLVMVKHGERLQIHEVKGWSKNLRDGMTRFKIASAVYYCWDWMLVKQIKGRWEFKHK